MQRNDQNPPVNSESSAALLLAAVRQITARMTALEEQVLVLSTVLEQHDTEIQQVKIAIDMIRSEISNLKAALVALQPVK
jgi:peptidoglycan hydrolase CwlO-like protein